MSENLPVRVKFFRRSIQQMIDSKTMPSNDLLRSLLVEDERLAEWERRTGTAPQRPKADPQMVTCFQCRGDGTCFATDDPCPVCGGLGSITDDPVAPAPQTEGEKPCTHCFRSNGYVLIPNSPIPAWTDCPKCSGTGKGKA